MPIFAKTKAMKSKLEELVGRDRALPYHKRAPINYLQAIVRNRANKKEARMSISIATLWIVNIGRF